MLIILERPRTIAVQSKGLFDVAISASSPYGELYFLVIFS